MRGCSLQNRRRGALPQLDDLIRAPGAFQQHFPDIGLDLPEQDEFDSPPARPPAPAQPRRHDFRIVDHEEVSRLQQLRQLRHATMGTLAPVSRNDQEASLVTWLHRPVRNKRRVEWKVEIR